MPEGPEIRKAADKLERALSRGPIQDIFFAFEHLRLYCESFRGQRVEAVQTRGKAMLIHVDNGLSIYSHNQLYGCWMIRRAQDYPDTRRQLRLAIHTGRHSALLYSASDISVWPVADLPQHPFLSKVGPDVLDPALTPAMLLERFKSPPYQRRQLAGLLLDQRFLCGIGNYLRSELLFVARLAPRLRSIDCPAERLQALAEAAIALPYQSYRYNGITNDLDLANQLKAQGQRRSQYRHWVFSRQGQPCRLCQTPIVKEMIGSRRVYYCPVCQGIGRF